MTALTRRAATVLAALILAGFGVVTGHAVAPERVVPSTDMWGCDIEEQECDPPEDTVVLSDCRHPGDFDCFWWAGAPGNPEGRTFLDYGGANWYREEAD
jgi:hypothetical protein